MPVELKEKHFGEIDVDFIHIKIKAPSLIDSVVFYDNGASESDR